MRPVNILIGVHIKWDANHNANVNFMSRIASLAMDWFPIQILLSFHSLSLPFTPSN